MNREQLKYLYPRVLSKEITRDELDELFAWFQSADLEELKKMIREELELDVPVEISEDKLQEIDGRVLVGLREMILKESVPVKRLSIWPRVAAVAAAVAVIVSGIYFFRFNDDKAAGSRDLAQADQEIVPGQQGATLTLASGKQIVLGAAKEGELAREAGVRIEKKANGQLVYVISGTADAKNSNQENTLSTANGETYQVRLPDGSMVWLNAASSLSYAANPDERGERSVRLAGEAYFQVAKDKSRPFTVHTAKQDVVVLGTHFNVNAYADEPVVRTTLLEGSVRVLAEAAGKGKAGVVLRPGEQSVLSGAELKVREVDAEDAVDWKNGAFVFEEEGIRSIMRRVSHWYDVEVRFAEDKRLDALRFNGSVSRFEKVSSLLGKLEKTGPVVFEIKDNVIYVSAK